MKKEELSKEESLNSNILRDYKVGSILKPSDKNGNPLPFTFKVKSKNSVLVEFNESDRIKPWGRDVVYVYFQKILATFIKERSKEKDNITFLEKTVDGDSYSVRYSIIIESETVEEAIDKSNALRVQINRLVYDALIKAGIGIIKKQKLNTGNFVEDFKLQTCPDCSALPGEMHRKGCDIERCSVCGGQYNSCGHDRHDAAFARWTGFYPGDLEARELGVDLSTLIGEGLSKKIFIKPKKK